MAIVGESSTDILNVGVLREGESYKVSTKYSSNYSLMGVSFLGNNAYVLGGGLLIPTQLNSNNTVNISLCDFYGNVAQNQGGGLYVEYPQFLFFRHNTLRLNRAKVGAGLYFLVGGRIIVQ